MSRQIAELETVLQQLIIEHRKLLSHLETYQAAMKRFDLKGMNETGVLQESSRMRIAALETRRRLITGQIARLARIQGEPTLSKLAALHPAQSASLLRIRDELKELVQAARSRAYVAGRVAGAVLGHLNTAVRLLAGAMGKAGVYTKDGIPKPSSRIGVMEAVG